MVSESVALNSADTREGGKFAFNNFADVNGELNLVPK